MADVTVPKDKGARRNVRHRGVVDVLAYAGTRDENTGHDLCSTVRSVLMANVHSNAAPVRIAAVMKNGASQ